MSFDEAVDWLEELNPQHLPAENLEKNTRQIRIKSR